MEDLKLSEDQKKVFDWIAQKGDMEEMFKFGLRTGRGQYADEVLRMLEMIENK
jgi:hypothetical protein